MRPIRIHIRQSARFYTTSLSLVLAAICVNPALSQTAASAVQGPAVITLQEAIHRAQANEPVFAAAVAQGKSSVLDRSIAKSALLPSVIYHNQVLYTQPNGLLNQAGQGAGAQPSPRFIANNAVREYASQAVVNETIGLKSLAAVRQADATAAQNAAELEVARRGLVTAVASLYYGALASDAKLTVAQSAANEAASFTDLTQKREQAREVAHADVVKAQLQQQQRQRDLSDASVAAEKMHLELATLLFPNPLTPYTLQAPESAAPLASLADVETAAARSNPELKSALAALQASNADVLAARAAYLPDLGLNFTYGIDAPQFAAKGPDGVHNLGYSASVTLDIPVWDWLATDHRVRQSEIRRDAVRVALTAAQRQFIAHLQETYSEAKAAQDQLKSLDDSVQTAEESLRLTKLRYANGEATALEVVDAETSLMQVEDARADGMVRNQTAIANLKTLTGEL